MLRGVAQMVARMVWDHEVAGSRPVTPTIILYIVKRNLSYFTRGFCIPNFSYGEAAMTKQIDAVIFDLDGTLLDSMWVWDQIDIDYFKSINVEIPETLKDEINHLSFIDTAKYFKTRFNLSESVQSILDTWNSMALNFYSSSVKLKPGALDYLIHLKSKDIKIGLATSNSHLLLNAALKHTKTEHFFDAIVTSDDINASKNTPAIYLETASRLKAHPSRCLVFEDILEAVKGAKLANMHVFAVHDKYSEYQKEDLIKESDKYIYSFYDLLN